MSETAKVLEHPKTAPLSIHGAMIRVMRNIRAIGKDKRNQQQGFNFRGIDDAYNAIQPLMAAAGIFTTSEVLDHQRKQIKTRNGALMEHVILTMAYTFWAEDGTSVTTQVLGEGMDMADKASNKAMAGADKYALLQAFKVPTEETARIDPDHETPPLAKEPDAAVTDSVEMITPKQVKDLKIMQTTLGIDDNKTKRYFNIDSFKDIPAKGYAKVERYLLATGAPDVMAIIKEAESAEQLEAACGKQIKLYPEGSKTRRAYADKMAELAKAHKAAPDVGDGDNAGGGT